MKEKACLFLKHLPVLSLIHSVYTSREGAFLKAETSVVTGTEREAPGGTSERNKGRP